MIVAAYGACATAGSARIGASAIWRASSCGRHGFAKYAAYCAFAAAIAAAMRARGGSAESAAQRKVTGTSTMEDTKRTRASCGGTMRVGMSEMLRWGGAERRGVRGEPDGGERGDGRTCSGRT